MKPIKSGVVSFPYGAKYKTGGIHKGIDYAATIGTPVVAAVPGVVVHAGKHIYKKGWGWAFGLHVIIDNDRFEDGSAGLWAGYCHLNGVNVAVGQRVRQGQLLGVSGNTGRAVAHTYTFKYLPAEHGIQPSTETHRNGLRHEPIH